MKQQSTEAPRSSSVQWDNLESWVRGHVQGFIQQILEEEVSEFLGRSEPQRRRPLSEGGYRNGRQFIVGSRRLCAFGYTEFCGGRISVKAQLIKEGFPSAGHHRIARIRWTIPQVDFFCAVRRTDS